MYLEIAFSRSEETLRKAALQKRAITKQATQRFELPVPAQLTEIARLINNSFHIDLTQSGLHGWKLATDEDGDFWHENYFCRYNDLPRAAGEELTLDETLAWAQKFTFTDAMKATNVAHDEKRAARLAQATAREKEVARTKEAALRTWAEAHGSELLRRRIAGKFEWQELAREEYAAQVAATTPALAELMKAPEDGSREPRRKPNLAEMLLLERVQKDLCTRGTAVLKSVTYTDDDDGSKSRVSELAVMIETPDGETETLYFSMPAPAKS